MCAQPENCIMYNAKIPCFLFEIHTVTAHCRSYSRDESSADTKSRSHHLPGYGLQVSERQSGILMYHYYFLHIYMRSVLRFNLLLEVLTVRFSFSAPRWQTTPVLRSLQSLRAPGEEPLPIASQEQQGKSLVLFLLIQR